MITTRAVVAFRHRLPFAAAVVGAILRLSAAWAGETVNLLPNGGFEEALGGWKTWGEKADRIVRDETCAHTGRAAVMLPGSGAALYTYVPLLGGHAYRLQGFYRCARVCRGGLVTFSLCARERGNGSAGTRQMSLPADAPEQWCALDQVIVATRGTVQCQVALSAQGGAVWFDDLSLAETALPEWADPGAGAWDGITGTRTEKPLFAELLSDQPGKYRVTMWPHALYRTALPMPDREQLTATAWERELRATFGQMGANHLNAFLLPEGVMRGEAPELFWRTDEFLRGLHEQHGLTFDAAAESSGVVARAVKLGAEVLNAKAVSESGAAPRVSLLDPAYLRASLDEIHSLDELLRGRPYVRALVGKDEPMAPVFPGLRAEAGPVLQAADAEVRARFGAGRYGLPAPSDPEWRARPEDHPFCGMAFHRWAADRYALAVKERYELLKQLDPEWLYVPCDFWLMSGLVPFDYSRMARYADMLQGDPYASSAERTRGRGIYNHGFGAKFLADLGRGSRRDQPKPVEIIVQAFDYAGYEMTPDDLLEWCSQALRCGATSLSFYASDAPRFNDPPRWGMMLHIAKTVSEMHALKLPTATKTAILFCSGAHAAEGPSSPADELYTAYALLGEKLGCWFDIVDERQLDRGLRKLADYRIVYLPLATYADTGLTAMLEDWVRGGGTLVCGDPGAFSWAPDGSETSIARERLLGIRTGPPMAAWSVMVGEKRVPLFPRRTEDGLQPTARTITLGGDPAEILGRYPDGTPAVIRRGLGQGKVIYFAANPFTPESLFHGAPWTELLKGFQKDAGEPMGLDIWRFKLPGPSAPAKKPPG